MRGREGEVMQGEISYHYHGGLSVYIHMSYYIIQPNDVWGQNLVAFASE